MTNTTQEMTAGTASQAERAAARAAARNPGRRTRGPMAEMMRDAGFTAEQIARTRDNFTGGAMEVEMVMCVGEAGRQAFRDQFDRVIADMA